MMLEAVLLTPLLLGVEPARLEPLDEKYDHRTQTSTFVGEGDKLAWCPSTYTHGLFDDTDYDCPPAPPPPQKCMQVCAQWNVFNPRLCFRYKTVCTDASRDPG